MIRSTTYSLVALSLLLHAAIFGFFYAWVCSTMWGLDAADPRIAIQAMQAMNASVRNAVFAPAFFGTPIISFLVAGLLYGQGVKRSAALFGAAGVTYLLLGAVLTMTINVPMNEALAQVRVPDDLETARTIWEEYSKPWQFWNITRTITSAAAFLLAFLGCFTLQSAKRA
ncbi:Uncharacterized membrane protein [Aliiroseovarius halocynthiae]|uniref:DUF1772 domain-containing protein n=1 Tax=Aliiroseovarius halocynthiae TaxID=985055 RepID=A0A545SKS1_9RHOB|nr:anthrone oxygenase family protein [Aliiroseovarius halocynthiae]TQV65584.1 DUF1772 domain-containing protein [Aliiroseovarius halocynthiae]SMR81687.1 Uncharacterized membrane protein [Aliiroseovarius halocynthiae]